MANPYDKKVHHKEFKEKELVLKKILPLPEKD
jgi:hypothetical protein